MSSRQQFLLPNVTPGTRVRLDTASGSTSAADVVDNLNQAISGSIITADSSGRLASGDVYGPAGVTTLYLKTLDGGGNVTATTTLGSSHPATGGADPRVDTLLSGAPGALDTLKELADALGDDASFAATVTTLLAGKENVVVHGSTAGTARPAAATIVHWIGSVAPTNGVTNDEWTDTTVPVKKRYTGSAWVSLSGASTTTPADVAAVGAVGTGTTLARADHVHGGAAPLANTTPAAAGGTAAAGSAASAARGDHVHAAPGLLMPFGFGFDGVINFDGTSTVTIPAIGPFGSFTIAPSSGVYTLSRSIYATSITVAAGATVKTNGFTMNATGTLTNNGTVHINGNSASGATGGTSSGVSNGVFQRGPAGANGSTGVGGAVSNPSGWAVTLGGNGGASGTGSAGGSANNGQTVGNHPGGVSGLLSASGLVTGFDATTITGGYSIGTLPPGGAGGGGGGDGTNAGGGGGGAGGVAIVNARILAGSGVFSANGGAGAVGVGGNAGGGGGGAGGVMIVNTTSNTGTATVTATGGAGGAAAGTGVAGGSGGTGLALLNIWT